MRLWNSETRDGQEEVTLRWDDIDTNSTHNIYKHTHILAKIFVGIMHNFLIYLRVALISLKYFTIFSF